MSADLRKLLVESDEGVGIDSYATPLQDILIQGIENSRESIAIADMRHHEQPLVYVNKAFTDVTGYGQEEVIGKNCRFLQGKDTDPEQVDMIRNAIKKHEPILVELVNYRKDGKPFFNRLSLVPIFDKQMRQTHYLAIQSDITAEKKLVLAQERTRGMKNTMEAVNDITGNLLNHMTLVLDQLKQSPMVEEDLLNDMGLSLGQAKERLDKINAMKAYAEKQYNESIFMIDYESSEGEDN